MTQPNLPGRPPQWASALLAEVQALRSEVATLRGVQPVPQFIEGEGRANHIAALRAMVDWLEANPQVPTPWRSSAYEHLSERDGSESENLAVLRRVAALFGVEADESANDRTQLTFAFGERVGYELVVWHRNGRPAEPAPVDDLGYGYSRTDDDPQVIRPHSPRVPPHTGAVVDGGELVDETPGEVHTAEVYFSEAYREAFGQWCRAGLRPSRDERHQAALDLLHGQALAEDVERARRADVRGGEQGRVTSVNVAYFLAAKEERQRIARHFLGLEESAKHYPADETEPLVHVRKPGSDRVACGELVDAITSFTGVPARADCVACLDAIRVEPVSESR